MSFSAVNQTLTVPLARGRIDRNTCAAGQP
jgi:hypothetical protein